MHRRHVANATVSVVSADVAVIKYIWVQVVTLQLATGHHGCSLRHCYWVRHRAM